MQTETQATVTVKLVMTKEEATWLRAYMQNAVTEVEDNETATNRLKVFEALSAVF